MNLALWTLAVAGSALVLTQSSITKPFRDWLANAAKRAEFRALPRATGKGSGGGLARPVGLRFWLLAKPIGLLSKLVSCPMCSGFWIGMEWSLLFGVRGGEVAAHGFGGSVVSALAVAAWLALGEAYAALGLWRYLSAEPPPPEGVCQERMRLAFRLGVGNPLSVVCPRHLAERNGQPCFPGKGEP